MIPTQQSGKNPFMTQSNSHFDNNLEQKVNSSSNLPGTYAAKAKEVKQIDTDLTDSFGWIKSADNFKSNDYD